jgi:hypothetical protein
MIDPSGDEEAGSDDDAPIAGAHRYLSWPASKWQYDQPKLPPRSMREHLGGQLVVLLPGYRASASAPSDGADT